MVDGLSHELDGSSILETSTANQSHSYNSSNPNNKQQIKLDYFSGQTLPLLDSTDENSHSDSEYSQYDKQNDVIFDVLKRRDGSR